MSEADAIALCTDGPVTRTRLVRDLNAIGVRPGSVLMVHCSMSRLGWIPGGVRTLCDALLEKLGPDGTLVVPTFTTDNSDPARWQSPPVPAEWVETIRADMPAFDKHLSSPRSMGALSRHVLLLPGVARSIHPALSWAAIGAQAQELCARHDLGDGFGVHSPCGVAIRMGADVLSLGCLRTTILHYAEALADHPGKQYYTQGCSMLFDGTRQWVEYTAMETNNDNFEELRQDYIAAGQPCSCGTVGYGMTRLFPTRELVEFAEEWLARMNSKDS